MRIEEETVKLLFYRIILDFIIKQNKKNLKL